MKRDDCDRMIHDLGFTAVVNQRYHQILEWRWATLDRLMRILIGVLAAFGVLLAALGSPWGTLSLVVPMAALIAAILLNILPFGEIQRFYRDLFRRWSDLRQEVELARMAVRDLQGQDVPEHLFQRLQSLMQRKAAILADEPAAWRGLLIRCQEETTESIWGKGIRTPEQVQQKLQELRSANTDQSAPGPDSDGGGGGGG